MIVSRVEIQILLQLDFRNHYLADSKSHIGNGPKGIEDLHLP